MLGLGGCSASVPQERHLLPRGDAMRSVCSPAVQKASQTSAQGWHQDTAPGWQGLREGHTVLLSYFSLGHSKGPKSLFLSLLGTTTIN